MTTEDGVSAPDDHAPDDHAPDEPSTSPDSTATVEGSTGPAGTARGLVFASGLPDASLTRVLGLGESGAVEVVDDVDRAGDAAVALVSTRLPRAELSALLVRLTEAGSGPVVALVHTGGEALAVEVVRRGGVAVVAEGNEAALAPLLEGEPAGAGLVESFDQHLSRGETATRGARGRDALTDLPDRSSLELLLEDLAQEDVVPRLVAVRVLRTPAPDETACESSTLVQRRLAVQVLHVGRAHDAQVFATAPWEFALVSPAMPATAVERLGRDLDRIASTYSPTGGHTLGVAVGHAGPEVSIDPTALVEAAHRAMDAATADRTQLVVGADALSSGVAATTELEAALRVIEHVERQAGLPAGHGARLAELAGTLAAALGYEGTSRTRIQLAAQLHAVGLAGLPVPVAEPDELEGDDLAAWREYPARSAAYVELGAGPEVAAAIRAHREHVDGTGVPDGLVGIDIPIGARVVAVARRIEALVRDGAAPERLASELQARAGTELDPDVVAAAVDVLDELVADQLAPAAG